jgi:signal transduction histidine kinase
MSREAWWREIQLDEELVSRLPEVLGTDQLPSRAPSPDTLLAEQGAVQAFFSELARESRAPLKTAAGLAQRLCAAESAGVSLVEATDARHPTLRISAVCGATRVPQGAVFPLQETPSGGCLKLGAPQLFRHPERCFPCLSTASLPIVEGLFVPLAFEDELLGTIWVTSHTDRRSFDLEDLRLLQNLGSYAAGALRIGTLLAQYEARLAEATATVARHEHTLLAHNDLIAELVHDLKNPITTIGLYAELSRQAATQLRGARQQQILDSISHVRAAARRLTDLVGHLAQMTISGGAAPEPRTRTELVALVETIVEEHQLVAQGRIRMAIPGTLITGPWAPISLQRIVENLLDNAIKYSPAGGLITVSAEIAEAGAERWAVLRVRDEGIGIPAYELPHVFDDLYRGSEALQLAPGSGLGLASVRHLVELHGGTIEITSPAPSGRGCEVCIRLPCDER